jgi:hypothetical protein
MRAGYFQSKLTGGLGLLLIAAAMARGEGGLMDSSPFLPAGAAPAAVATDGPIEFHGYLATAEGEKFSIYSPATKTAMWVGLNEKGRPFVVRSHKTVNSTDQITVDYQGQSLVLALKAPKIAALAVSASPVFGPNGGMPLVTAPAVQTPPPSLPAGASLDEWAAEVQRRRALRQQTPAQTVPAPVAPAPAAPGATQR